MRNSKFTNKEEYFQYRKDWKEEYMALTQHIRDHKLIRRYSSQACNKAIQMIGGVISYDNVGKYFRYIEINKKENPNLQLLLVKYKDDKTCLSTYTLDATNMLEELKYAKIEANRQYLDSHSVKAVIA